MAPERREVPSPQRREPPVERMVEDGRRRRVSPWLLLVGALLVAVLVWWLLTSLTDDGAGDDTQTDRTATTQTTPTPSSSPSPSSEQPAPTSAAPTTATPTTATPSRSATPNQAARLSAAITDYYALLPGDTAAAWPLMTADYQSGTSGGRRSYEAFWGAIREVAVSDVEATPPDRVVATITYSRDNGRVDIERTSYRLVDEGGVLKIAASQVLSSRRG